MGTWRQTGEKRHSKMKTGSAGFPGLGFEPAAIAHCAVSRRSNSKHYVHMHDTHRGLLKYLTALHFCIILQAAFGGQSSP